MRLSEMAKARPARPGLSSGTAAGTPCPHPGGRRAVRARLPGNPAWPRLPRRSSVAINVPSTVSHGLGHHVCGDPAVRAVPVCPSQPFRVPGIQNPGIFTRWSPPAPAHSNSDVWAGPSFSYIILHVRFSAYSFQVPVVAWQVFPRTVVMAENRLLPEVFLEAASTFLYFPTQ